MTALAAATLLIGLSAWAQETSIVWEPGARHKDLESELVRVFKGHRHPVSAVAVSPDGRFALSGSHDNTVKYWDLRTGELLRTFKEGRNWAASVAFSPDGKTALGGNFDRSMRLWDLPSGRLLRTFENPDCAVSAVAFTPDGRFILSGCYDGILISWDAATGAQLWKESAHFEGEMTIRVAPDGRHALTLGEMSGSVKFWEISSGKLVKTFKLADRGALYYDMALSPDGGRFLVTNGVSELQHWDISTGRRLSTIEAPNFSAYSVAFLPDGRHAVVGGAGAFKQITLGLWDIPGRKLLGTMEGHENGSSSIAISPDGRFVLSGGGDNRVKRSMISLTKGGLELFSDLAGMTLERAMAEHAGERPQAPVLAQGKYESTAEFQARVAKAQAEFAAQAGEYNEKVKAFPDERKDEIVENAFFSVFGEPRVSKTSYDADSQIFSLELSASGKNAGGFTVRLALKDPVSRSEAETFEGRLQKADPKLLFTLDAGRLSLREAALIVRGKAYAAVPTEDALQKSLARVNLGSLEKNLLKTNELAVELVENPELAQKAMELDALRKKKAQAEEVKRLESEIQRLQGETVKTYRSDVDEPGENFPERPQDFAVVVGIGGYNKLPEAEFAERDAQAVARQFRALGVPEQNLIALSGKDATLAKLAGYLEEWLPKVATPDSRIYFYFSGHGAPDPASGEAYLAPWDADASFLKSTAFPLKRLYSGLGALKAKEVLLVMDACFSGAGGRSVLAKGTRPLVMRREDSEAAPSNITLLAASSGEEITGSLESQGHGLFTYHFLKALRQSPRKASALYGDLKPKVESEAMRQNRLQTPVFRGPDIHIP